MGPRFTPVIFVAHMVHVGVKLLITFPHYPTMYIAPSSIK